MVRTAALGLFVLLLGGTAGAATATPSTLSDPYQIYARTRTAWESQRYPDYLAYTIHVEVDEGGVHKSKHYHAVYEQPNGKIHLIAVSDEEIAQPPAPTGMTIHLLPKRQNATLIDKRVGHPDEAVDYLGIPMLSPNYSFGLGIPQPDELASDAELIAQIRSEYHDPAPVVKPAQVDSDGKLKSIAAITVIARRYRIELAGIETIEGTSCYHLVLYPSREPQRFRLRDLWIDVENYQTRRLLAANNFMNSKVPWLVTFADVGGARYIESEVAQAPVVMGGHRYEHAQISFEEVAPAARPVPFDSRFLTSENILREPPL
ncbi:MAG TPA: hypothetical protein VFO29_03680 [Candidatus Rubrimentiphilum sp.]|nr:hypothetical protein [Candidatus Rubrimentiphilum sp.]